MNYSPWASCPGISPCHLASSSQGRTLGADPFLMTNKEAESQRELYKATQHSELAAPGREPQSLGLFSLACSGDTQAPGSHRSVVCASPIQSCPPQST
jgi:hypothetical protein